MKKFKKVLILSASAGAGHLRAAEALEKTFHEMNTAEEVKNIDTLEYTNQVFRRLYSRTYIDLVNKSPELLGWLYDAMDKPWEYERRRLFWDKLNTVPFVKMLQEYQPEIAVCTHFLPAEIISWLKAKKKLATKQVIVVTDLDVHAMWLCHHYEQYFVAIDETRVHLEELGIPPEKITVSGIPIDPAFARPKEKSSARKKLGLKPDRPTILLSAGGFGVGPVEHMLQTLGKMKHPAQVVAVCGRNEELKTRLTKQAGQMPADSKVDINVIGFTREMDEYMAAADILLGKPGGLTTSEALARGLVFVIVNPIPGQEERNSDHLLEEGVALRCNNLPTLAYKIDTLLDDPGRMKRMQKNARRLAQPSSAQTIVKKLLELNQ
jgi:processive 1,2-diacylglycerol beta-glucosyltransferase